ncbi:hypothetical protein ACS0TY_008961 [Phlomoides rotata]
MFKSSSVECLPDPASQYQLLPSHSKIRTGRGDSVIAKMIKLGKTMYVVAQGIREHGEIEFGARIVQLGGVEKVFKHKFNTSDSEKLVKASQCYLWTTAGPIAGLLFKIFH